MIHGCLFCALQFVAAALSPEREIAALSPGAGVPGWAVPRRDAGLTVSTNGTGAGGGITGGGGGAAGGGAVPVASGMVVVQPAAASNAPADIRLAHGTRFIGNGTLDSEWTGREFAGSQYRPMGLRSGERW
jgi:hypothetical protein